MDGPEPIFGNLIFQLFHFFISLKLFFQKAFETLLTFLLQKKKEENWEKMKKLLLEILENLPQVIQLVITDHWLS